MRNIFILYFIKRINLLHIMQNGLYDVNWKIKKKKIDQKNIKQKPLCVYCFLVKQKKLFGQLNIS